MGNTEIPREFRITSETISFKLFSVTEKTAYSNTGICLKVQIRSC